jgi:multiple sugar transport system permease protein
MQTQVKQKSNQLNSVLSVIGIIILTVFTVLCIFPFIYMILLSLTQSKTLNIHLEDVKFDFVNYIYVFTKSSFLNALKNSIIVVIFSCLLNCIMCAMAAYGFEKKKFPGKELLFSIYIATLMVPGQVTLIPLFIMMKNAGMLNNYITLMLPILNAFGVFLVRQFMAGVPDELLEAAKVDGCHEWRIFLQIVIPLIKPVLVSLTVFTFVTSWNDFLWPLVATTKSEMSTLTVALSLLKTNYSANYGLVMAGAAISFAFPFCLYAFLQRQFVEGIALSGIKG